MVELRTRLGQQTAARQVQGLTPAQQQSIKLLGLTNVELAALLAEALVDNPLLEPAADLPEAARARLKPPAKRPPGLPASRRMGPLPAGLGRIFAAAARGRGGAGSTGEASPDLAEPGPTLQEHLSRQLGADVPDPLDRRIGQAMIESLDEAGYLTLEPAAIALRLAVEPARAERVLARLQGFEPPGVFARSLAECLALQLADRGRLDAPMQRLLERLDLLAEGRREALRRHCGVEADRLAAMIAELRRLDPRPGLAFERSVVQEVAPDLALEPDGAGGWRVELNSETLPRLAINVAYSAGGAEAAAYLKDRRAAAQWLLRALDRRADTLRRVAQEIVRRQAGFLERGPAALKPLSRREIAHALELHESTVSRAIAGKHAATPRGVLELSAFFGGGLRAVDKAGTLAPAAVRVRLGRMIAAEGEGMALSDREIVRRLHDEGIDLSRRTVAKYRKMLKIAPSHRRRRQSGL